MTIRLEVFPSLNQFIRYWYLSHMIAEKAQMSLRKWAVSLEPSCADPEGGGGQGVGTPLENQKNIRFVSNTGPDPLKHHRATKPAFNVGPSSARQRNAL